ncbi:hypothetical protein B9Z65_8872 [Elsinoe australis]|uniref:Methyltransferase domain-containing protein n=1 Tax=Elsinoe australis TaxID=40998 RepID=A0A2P7YF14_9PEZI|nr:hypothetical protein B9Z65_8872 [Elsinoe australis]
MPQPPRRSTAKWFNQLAGGYARQTGNSTKTAVTQALQLPHISRNITTSTILHDNACGPGTASLAVIEHLGQEPARIEGTDSSEGMVDAFKHTIAAADWQNVNVTVMASENMHLPDNTFTTSITNISMTNFADGSQVLREVRRTLKPRGLAVVVQWKQFTVAEIIHNAQRTIKPDAVLMSVPGVEWMADGYIKARFEDTGFADVRQTTVDVVVSGEDIQGLREFMLGNFTAEARAGWSKDEEGRWEAEIDKEISRQVARHGGVKMMAWVVTGKKE